MTLFAEMFDSLAAPAIAGVLGNPVAATIEAPPTAYGTFGQPSTSDGDWTTFAAPDVIICPLTGEEKWEAEKAHGDVSHCVWVVPRVAGVTTAMRVKVGARTLNIRAVLDRFEQFNQLKLLCLERTN